MLDSNRLSFPAATGAFTANRRMKVTSSGTLDYADAGDRAMGTLLTDIDSTITSRRTGAILQFATGIHNGTYASATALAVGDELQAADDGKITKRTTGPCVGIAVETASADGDLILYLPVEAAGAAFAGDGGKVTQETSASTGVTLSKRAGQITTVALTTAGAAEEVFAVTNTLVEAQDIIVVSTTYAGQGTPAVTVKGVADGSFSLVITNLSASALNAAVVVNFRVLKGACDADLA